MLLVHKHFTLYPRGQRPIGDGHADGVPAVAPSYSIISSDRKKLAEIDYKGPMLSYMRLYMSNEQIIYTNSTKTPHSFHIKASPGVLRLSWVLYVRCQFDSKEKSAIASGF